ncbi:hypothetical protein SELMODRAFT_421357 [Selaginella moellendorffii]|uniref:Uncharacterized protein n=1 Tax=Selaginella moellendorffii TaxID=88036 RepID=D8SF08_SELML|nr:hypothetical protein SELMODRAFT_421357 [Selaginella moellendorffii]
MARFPALDETTGLRAGSYKIKLLIVGLQKIWQIAVQMWEEASACINLGRIASNTRFKFNSPWLKFTVVNRVLKPYFLEQLQLKCEILTRCVQQFVVDGYHLTRDTLSGIKAASFASSRRSESTSSAFLVIGTTQSLQL